MSSKILLAAFTLMLLAGSGSAATQTFGGWLKNGESTTTDRQSFLIQIDSAGNSAWADYGTGALRVGNNSCDQTLTAKVCVDNIEYPLPDRRYRAYLRVYSLAPKITIEREFANTKLTIGNDTVVTVSIENEGDVAATNVVYVDALSEDIAVEEISGASHESGKVVWRGTIKAGNTQDITYRIRPKEAIDRKFSATVSYYDGFDTRTVSSSEIALKVTPFITASAKINGRADILIGEIFNYTVNITNLDTHPVVFSYIEVKTDKGIEITEKPYELKKTGENAYRYENWGLIQNRSKVFRFKAKGKLVSESNVYMSGEYTGFDKINREIEEQKNPVRITEKGVTIKTNLGEKIIEEGEEKKLSISVSNNNPAASLKDVFVAASSNLLYIPNAYYGGLEASRTERIEKTFTVPEVKAQQGYTIHINVTYTTEYGDSGGKTLTDTVSVVPIKDLVVTQTISETEIEGGEQATVKIRVENPRLVKVDGVNIRSRVPEQMLVSGATSNTVSIYSKETVDGLAYFVTAPKTRKTERYNITTEVWYDRYRYNATTVLTVKPKDIRLSVTKSAETDIYEGEPFSLAYSIRNPSAEDAAENVTISFPLQQEFDLIGETKYTIPRIGPGETVYISGKERIRAKYNTSLTLAKTTVSYNNEEGVPFSANSSELSITVKTTYKRGPYIILGKKAPESANDVDSFNITIKAKNIGDERGTAYIKDGQHEWSVLLDAGAEKEFIYEARIPDSGANELARATAVYSYGNRTFATASNAGKITIEHKPLIDLERLIPAEGNTIDNINITLKITNLLGKKVSNLTIRDSGNEWMIYGSEELHYIMNFTSPGTYTLGRATASYSYEGGSYETETEEASIAIAEKKVLALEKSAPATAAGNFTVTITATSLYPLENVRIRDNGREWKVSIPEGREEISYTMQLADSGSIGAASATFSYNGREFTEYSNDFNVEVRKERTGQEKTAEQKPQGPIPTILYLINKVLTWQRKS